MAYILIARNTRTDQPVEGNLLHIAAVDADRCAVTIDVWDTVPDTFRFIAAHCHRAHWEFEGEPVDREGRQGLLALLDSGGFPR
jgi:hypothetical protein